MLPDRYRQLLTAYVDGELTNRQRRHVAKLLRRSVEARQLLQQLQEDARTLRQLPRPTLPMDFTFPVLRTIAERGLAPGRRRTHASANVSWMGPLAAWSAAAAVLIILGTTSYLYFALTLTPPNKPEMVKTEPNNANPEQPVDAPPPSPAPKDEPPRPPTSVPPAAKDAPRPTPQPPAVVQHPKDKQPSPPPDKPPTPSKDETAFTERLEMFRFQQVSDLLPLVYKVSDLERDAGQKELLAELRKDSNFRAELPCPNNAKAIERVQKAAQAVHLRLIIDKQAQERIKQKWRVSYALYVENLTPEEFTRFIRQIGIEDRKSAAGKATEVQVDRLVLQRMSPQHRKELSNLLGLDPTTTAPTASQPQAGKPADKPPEQVVLVLAPNAARPAGGSDEVKRFLDGRKPARAGTIRVLLLLRG